MVSVPVPLLPTTIWLREAVAGPPAAAPSTTAGFGVVVSIVGWSPLPGTLLVLQFELVNQLLLVAPVHACCACAAMLDASHAVEAISARRNGPRSLTEPGNATLSP